MNDVLSVPDVIVVFGGAIVLIGLFLGMVRLDWLAIVLFGALIVSTGVGLHLRSHRGPA